MDQKFQERKLYPEEEDKVVRRTCLIYPIYRNRSVLGIKHFTYQKLIRSMFRMIESNLTFLIYREQYVGRDGLYHKSI